MNSHIVGFLFAFADVVRGTNIQMNTLSSGPHIVYFSAVVKQKKKKLSKPFFDSSEHRAQKVHDKIISKIILNTCNNINF